MTLKEVRNKIVKLYSRKDLKVANLKDCLEIEDWHGVMDASADIREIVTEITVLQAVQLDIEHPPLGEDDSE